MRSWLGSTGCEHRLLACCCLFLIYRCRGNFLIIAGSTLAITGLTFAGIRFPWTSVQVLAPLIIGLVLIVAFFVYEWKVAKEPTIPWEVLNNRTSVGGYATPTSLLNSSV